ncbi:Coiled-coil domain-containing protein 134 [Anthophora retusa]
MPRVLVYIAVALVLTYITHAQRESPPIETGQFGGKSQNNSSPKVYEELFKKSFSYQRKEHTEAVKRLQKIDSYERLYKMITVLGGKMIDVIETSKALIENGGFNPDKRTLPQNVTIQSAISTTLENAAFFGDIVLHFPHIAHRILRAQQTWNPTVHWSLNFTNRMRHLLDAGTVERIHLASQELNIVEREPEYFNPYWQSTESRKEDKTKKKKPTKTEKQKKGPRMIKIEL